MFVGIVDAVRDVEKGEKRRGTMVLDQVQDGHGQRASEEIRTGFPYLTSAAAFNNSRS